MKHYRWTITGMAVLCMVLAFARADDGPALPAHSVSATPANLAWLAGSWKGTSEQGRWEASYTTPDGGVILSSNKEFRGDRVVMIEFECFQMIDGVLTLTPYPFGKKSDTTFPLKEIDDTQSRAVFANPEHDFPKEITYHRSAANKLEIKVTGELNGKPAEVNLTLHNAASAPNE